MRRVWFFQGKEQQSLRCVPWQSPLEDCVLPGHAAQYIIFSRQHYYYFVDDMPKRMTSSTNKASNQRKQENYTLIPLVINSRYWNYGFLLPLMNKKVILEMVLVHWTANNDS
jgi:hypothetical protein